MYKSLFLLGCVLISLAATAFGSEVGGMTLSRSISGVGYTPGERVEITVTVNSSLQVPPRGLGVEETIPEDWIYVGFISGQRPPLEPFPGTDSFLEFVWFSMPTFPLTFSYAIRVPEEATGIQTISGIVRYRIDGPELISPETLRD